MTRFEEHTISYEDGKKMFFLASGPLNGPLVVFVHGWPDIALTWASQLEYLASLGCRVIAPDMPGYGRSSARRRTEDYSLESINQGMVALLEYVGRKEAIWIGHDWGCGAVFSFAEHFPTKCAGVAGLAIPAHTAELGLEQFVRTVNRDLYPESEYPYGQWSYQAYYEQDFMGATEFFDKDPGACLKLLYSRPSPDVVGTRALTSTVVKDGGWFGGIEKPDPNWRQIPTESLCMDEDIYQEVTAALRKTGFWGGNAWYLNHSRNITYFNEKKLNDGYLHMPVLFIEASYDNYCDVAGTTLATRQRQYCTKLTEAAVEAGHWVAQEKPDEVNAIIAEWIRQSIPQYWPNEEIHGRRKRATFPSISRLSATL